MRADSRIANSAQDVADGRRERASAVGFAEKAHAWCTVSSANELLRVAGREQDFQVWSQIARSPYEIVSVHAVRHDHVGEQKVEGYLRAQKWARS